MSVRSRFESEVDLELPTRGSLDHVLLLKLIGNVELLGEPAWPGAKDGDAASAICVAVRVARDARSGPERRRLAMAALKRCAIENDPAARVVLGRLLAGDAR